MRGVCALGREQETFGGKKGIQGREREVFDREQEIIEGFSQIWSKLQALTAAEEKAFRYDVSPSEVHCVVMIDQLEIHNGNFQSNIERRSFCYQLLLYLAEVNKNRIKPLMPAYGLTKKYDYRTNDDVKINHFINKNILQSKLVLEIGVMLEEYLEKNKPKQNKVVYNYFRQILNIDHNMGNIIQPTIKTNVTLDDNLDNDSDD